MKPDLISSAIDKLELLDIYLNESSIIRDKNFDYGADISKLEQQSRLTASADILNTTDDVELNNSLQKGSLLRATVNFGIRFVESNSQNGNNEDNVLASIEASFCAVYSCKDELTDDELTEFVQFNTIHNIWPFWREHALRMSAESKLPRPLIPLMRPKK